MKAIGTNTAQSTSAMAMIGPVTSLIACSVASRGLNPASILRSTFSTTTMASSTTMPMARTRPNNDRALIENPHIHMPANVPTIDVGTARSGMIDARQVCRNRMTTSTTSAMASRSVCTTALIESADEYRGVVDDAVIHPFREILLQLLHRGAHAIGDLNGVRAGRLEDWDRDGLLIIE